MINRIDEPRVGAKAPDFFVESVAGKLPLCQLAAGHKSLVLTTQDSYRYHPK